MICSDSVLYSTTVIFRKCVYYFLGCTSLLPHTNKKNVMQPSSNVSLYHLKLPRSSCNCNEANRIWYRLHQLTRLLCTRCGTVSAGPVVYFLSHWVNQQEREVEIGWRPIRYEERTRAAFCRVAEGKSRSFNIQR